MNLFELWLPRIKGESTTLQQFHTDHGEEHWRRVLSNGEKLAALTPAADITVVQLFAVFHDSMRESEYEDREHGERGYQLAVKLGAVAELTDDQQYQLAEACIMHDSGLLHKEPTIAVCWDADRLDLPRVGITPEEKYFSTSAGKAAVMHYRENA